MGNSPVIGSGVVSDADYMKSIYSLYQKPYPNWVHIVAISEQTAKQLYQTVIKFGIDPEHDVMNDGLSALCLLARYGTAEAFAECYNRVSTKTLGQQLVVIPPHANLYFQAIVFNPLYGLDIIRIIATKFIGSITDKFVSLAQIDDQLANANRGRGKRIKDDIYGRDDRDMFFRRVRLLRIDDIGILPDQIAKCLSPSKQVSLFSV